MSCIAIFNDQKVLHLYQTWAKSGDSLQTPWKLNDWLFKSSNFLLINWLTALQPKRFSLETGFSDTISPVEKNNCNILRFNNGMMDSKVTAMWSGASQLCGFCLGMKLILLSIQTTVRLTIWEVSSWAENNPCHNSVFALFFQKNYSLVNLLTDPV